MTAQTDGTWVLEQAVVLGSQHVIIKVDLGKDMTLAPQQRQALRDVFALGPDALDNAAPAVVQNYEVYRDLIGDNAEAPPLEQPVDVWQQVQIAGIVVPYHDATRHAYFLIEGECDWDPEHGLEVRFRDGVAIEADQIGQSGGAQDDTPERLALLRQLIADAAARDS